MLFGKNRVLKLAVVPQVQFGNQRPISESQIAQLHGTYHKLIVHLYCRIDMGNTVIVEIFGGFNFGHFRISPEFLISGGI